MYSEASLGSREKIGWQLCECTRATISCARSLMVHIRTSGIPNGIVDRALVTTSRVCQDLSLCM